jgi:hypothetical protein
VGRDRAVPRAGTHRGPRGPAAEVAFQGGQTFTGPLSPHGNETGTRAQPLTFTSYGTGQALLAGGVFLRSIGYLTLADLSTTNPSGPGVFSSAGGTGVAGLVISGSTVAATSSHGIASNLAADAGWVVRTRRSGGRSTACTRRGRAP